MFGLSMDYEVFLLSRIRDEHVAGGSNEEAIDATLIRCLLIPAAMSLLGVELAATPP